MRESERLKLKSLLDTGKTNEEILEAMKPRRGNGNGHEIPEGGISVREAARKYGISRMTVSRLANSGKVKILARTTNWLYIDEAELKLVLGNN